MDNIYKQKQTKHIYKMSCNTWYTLHKNFNDLYVTVTLNLLP